MGKVYVVQEPHKREKGLPVPTMDISPAMVYGELVTILPPLAKISMLTPGPLIHAMKQKMQDFSDDDYLLALGDPSAIAVAAIVASRQNNGRLKLLKWDRRLAGYVEVRIEV